MNKIIFLTVLCTLMSCGEKDENYNCSINYLYKINLNKDFYPDSEIFKIRYLSDSIEISGIIVKPIDIPNGNKLPVIIYNRGGNRDFEAITKQQLKYLKYLSSFGYVVMASQYRGNSFSEGVDEFGGNDVDDIKCLINIAKDIDYMDEENIGVLGFSRGGLMAYILSKESNEIKTIVTVGAPTNLFLSSKNRPELYENVFLELIGDSVNKREGFEKRSAIYWAKEINEPTLILHGTEDKRVSINQSKQLIDSLQNNSNKISHLFVENGNHSLSNFRKERNKAIIEWFNSYLKP